jgi:hypothetical protein
LFAQRESEDRPLGAKGLFSLVYRWNFDSGEPGTATRGAPDHVQRV